jgi:ribonuclease E
MSRQRIRTSVLESSTEKCPYCGGSGHVRSVSSLALQVLRALEEQLMKGATHNLVARTRPDVALYVLNQKRAHLRALEQRFAITITVVADATVTAPQSFMIERGEQVHTAEAARALAEQNQSVAVVPLEEDDDLEEADTGEVEVEAGAETETDVSAAADAAESESGEGGTRRRRRRRRRGGREGRDGGEQPHHETSLQQEDATPAGDDVFADSGDEAAGPDADLDAAQGSGEDMPGETAEQGDRDEQHGDRRRRRRGRRGGRRSRHERNGEADRETGDHGAGAHDAFAPGDDMAEPPPVSEPELTAAASDLASASPSAPEPAMSREPAAAMPPPELYAPAVVPPAEPEPPRRRSTVRERAPVASDEARAPAVNPPAPPAAPAAEPTVTDSSEDEETDRPRRTGWWSRRFGRG